MKTLFLCLLAFAAPLASLAADPHSLSVRGEGEIKVAPDVAILSLQVRAKDKDAHAAQEANAKEMARVNKVLKNDFHLDANSIQTSGFGVNPEYHSDRNNAQVFEGYSVTHGLEVRVKDLEKVGALLDKLVTKNQRDDVSLSVQGISFDTDKRRDYETEALGTAMANAHARAEALAGFAKKSLRGVLRISDSNVQFEPVHNQMARMHVFTAAAGSASPTEIAGGQISISSSVSVEYEIN